MASNAPFCQNGRIYDVCWGIRSARLAQKISLALDLYPCDLLFVHRDAEGAPWESREREIRRAVEETKFSDPPYVCIVPVRMQEAWLLFDEAAIRYAAGNRNGRMSLELPRLRDVESLSDPKIKLHECLRVATGLSGRRLQQFRPHANVWRIADYIEDYSPLRGVPAFDRLENEIAEFVLSRNLNAN